MSEKPSHEHNSVEKAEKNLLHSLVIPRKQLTYITASLLIIGFVLFMSGYFLGKKRTIDQLLESVEQESFSDHIYASLCSLYSRDEAEEDVSDEDEVAELTVLTGPPSLSDESEGENGADEGAEIETEFSPLAPDSSEISSPEEQALNKNDAIEEGEEDSPRYVALLIGFGTYNAAHHCASRLVRKGFPVHVENRSSTTARGKKVRWYQVVTQSYENRDHLEELVDRISEQEKIKDARIIVVS